MKEIVSYLPGSFIDYKGVEHKIIICGVTTKRDDCDLIMYDENESEHYYPIEKTLMIGVAICNPADEYDQVKGEMMAYSRAKSEYASIILTTSRRGMFNTTTVNAILSNYLDYIVRDPGSIIKGYDKGKANYLEKQKLMDDIANMNEEDLEFLTFLAAATPENIAYAKKIVKLL